MNAGAFKEKIWLQKCTITADGLGNKKEDWKDHRRLYGYANGLSGREYWEAAGVQAEHTINFIFRWHPWMDGLNTKEYRLLFRGGVYNITSIDNIQFRNQLVKIRAVSEDGK